MTVDNEYLKIVPCISESNDDDGSSGPQDNREPDGEPALVALPESILLHLAGLGKGMGTFFLISSAMLSSLAVFLTMSSTFS